MDNVNNNTISVETLYKLVRVLGEQIYNNTVDIQVLASLLSLKSGDLDISIIEEYRDIVRSNSKAANAIRECLYLAEIEHNMACKGGEDA